MSVPVVYGTEDSTYVRSVRLTLEEKGVAYGLEYVDPFANDGLPQWYLKYHPFGKVPAFEHDGFRLYETDAIMRYVDEAFPGPSLIPDSTIGRARMTQIMRILDNYAYRTLVWDLYVALSQSASTESGCDTDPIADAMREGATCLGALAELPPPGAGFLVGGQLSLADLHAAPIFSYLVLVPQGRTLLQGFPALQTWWEGMRSRASMLATKPPQGPG